MRLPGLVLKASMALGRHKQYDCSHAEDSEKRTRTNRHDRQPLDNIISLRPQNFVAGISKLQSSSNASVPHSRGCESNDPHHDDHTQGYENIYNKTYRDPGLHEGELSIRYAL